MNSHKGKGVCVRKYLYIPFACIKFVASLHNSKE